MDDYINIVYFDLLKNKMEFEYLYNNPYEPKFKIENFNHVSLRQRALVKLARDKLAYMKRIFDGFVPDGNQPFLEAVADHHNKVWNDKIYLITNRNGEIEYYYQSGIREGLNKIILD